MVVRGVRVKSPGRSESGLNGEGDVACAVGTSWRYHYDLELFEESEQADLAEGLEHFHGH